MSDDTTNTPTATDEALQHPPVEDYSGDDTTNARGRVMQPDGDENTGADDRTADDPVTDATELPADPSLGG